MRRALVIIVILLFSIYSKAQKFTISGVLTDQESGELLIGANLYDANSLKGATTNFYGFYSLTLPQDQVVFTASFVGYKIYQNTFFLNHDTTINIQLEPSIELSEVTVTGTSVKDKVQSTQMSSIQVPINTVKTLPVLLGETDILKSIQLLPGVQSGNEGTSGLYVRGGGPDQNLFLLDGVPVYNANHLFGFFSVFNADAINTVELIKGGFPARYGGRLSSVIDIRMKEGNNKKLKGSASLGIISSKLTLEGPIVNDKTTFIISGRRTYIDILARPIIKLIDENVKAGYYFYDTNAKINHKINDNNRIYLSAYMGNDKAYTKFKDSYIYDEDKHELNQEAALQWGNITTALRWNSILSNKLFSNTTLTYSRYRFSISNEMGETIKGPGINNSNELYFEYLSGITDLTAKVDFDYLPDPNHTIRFGVSDIGHTFKPGVNVFQFKTADNSESIDTTFGNKNIKANELSAYIEDDVKIGSLLKVNAGFYFSSFNVRGITYNSIQPRISGRYLISENLSIKASYSLMSQNLLLLTNSTIGLPTDLWLPVTDKIKPMNSSQAAFGSSYNLLDKVEISVEGFYKTMENLIEYKDGANFFNSQGDWESQVETGEGWSYGGELLLQKDAGKITGWIGYTLSWTYRKFENIGFGKKFPYRYDRRHDIGIALIYKFNENIDIGLTWVYGTGNAVTLAQEKYLSLFSVNNSYSSPYGEFFGGTDLYHYDNRNGFRMPSYHRMDVGFTKHKQHSWGEFSWTVGLYNAYNRQNPFYLYFGYKNNTFDSFGNSQKVLKQVSLFPIIPSIRFEVKF